MPDGRGDPRALLAGPWPWWFPVGMATLAATRAVVSVSQSDAAGVVGFLALAAAFLVLLPLASHVGEEKRSEPWPEPDLLWKGAAGSALVVGAVGLLVQIVMI